MKAILSLLFILISFQKATALIDWSTTPVQISTPGVDATFSKVGIDSNGNAVAIWLEGGVVKSSSLPVDGSWSETSTVSIGGNASSPQLVMDPNGNATAIWSEGGSIQTATRIFGDSWGTPVTLLSAGGSEPKLSVDASGNVVAIWVASGAIQSNTKLYGGSWGILPSVLAASGANAPQIAIGSSGKVFAVWYALNPISSMSAIYSSAKTISGTWSTATVLSNNSQNCNYPNIAVDSSGNAIAVWYRYSMDGSQYTNVVAQAAQYYASGFTWTSPTDLSSAGILNPAKLKIKVEFSVSGNATAVWTNSLDGSYYTLFSASLPVNGSWTSANVILTDLYAASFSTNIDSAGDLYLVYPQYNYNNSTITINNSLSILGGNSLNYWTYIGPLSTVDQSAYPQVAITSSSSSNNGVAVWTSYDGSNLIIQAVSGNGIPVQPPTDLSVVQNETNYGVLQEYANTVSWEASPSPTVGFYLVFRNNFLIQDVPSYQLSIVDPNAVAGGSVTYGIASVDGYTGEVSATAYVSYP